VDDRQRKRAFAGAALALLAIANAHVPRTRSRSATGPAAAARDEEDRTTVQARAGRDRSRGHGLAILRCTVGESVAGPAARGEREPKSAPAVASGKAAVAVGAARAFLTGYLPYSYGRAEARAIHRAATPLLHELAVSPPSVLATVARARPRLISLRAEATLGVRAIDVLAVVDDGQRRYHITLELRHTRGAWLVTAVGA
jgi:hypothetical protein